MAAATEPLVCDQVECHPFLDQSKVFAACRSHGMALVAYSPLARGQFPSNEVLNRIGATQQENRGANLPALLVPQDIVVIPRSSKLERLTENASLFDFTLSESEIAEIAAFGAPQQPHRRLGLFGPHEVGLSCFRFPCKPSPPATCAANCGST